MPKLSPAQQVSSALASVVDTLSLPPSALRLLLSPNPQPALSPSDCSLPDPLTELAPILLSGISEVISRTESGINLESGFSSVVGALSKVFASSFPSPRYSAPLCNAIAQFSELLTPENPLILLPGVSCSVPSHIPSHSVPEWVSEELDLYPEEAPFIQRLLAVSPTPHVVLGAVGKPNRSVKKSPLIQASKSESLSLSSDVELALYRLLSAVRATNTPIRVSFLCSSDFLLSSENHRLLSEFFTFFTPTHTGYLPAEFVDIFSPPSFAGEEFVLVSAVTTEHPSHPAGVSASALLPSALTSLHSDGTKTFFSPSTNATYLPSALPADSSSVPTFDLSLTVSGITTTNTSSTALGYLSYADDLSSVLFANLPLSAPGVSYLPVGQENLEEFLSFWALVHVHNSVTVPAPVTASEDYPYLLAVGALLFALSSVVVHTNSKTPLSPEFEGILSSSSDGFSSAMRTRISSDSFDQPSILARFVPESFLAENPELEPIASFVQSVVSQFSPLQAFSAGVDYPEAVSNRVSSVTAQLVQYAQAVFL